MTEQGGVGRQRRAHRGARLLGLLRRDVFLDRRAGAQRRRDAHRELEGHEQAREGVLDLGWSARQCLLRGDSRRIGPVFDGVGDRPHRGRDGAQPARVHRMRRGQRFADHDQVAE